MAAGRKLFTREVLASADVQNFLMDQAAMRFPSAAVADAELPPAAREDGMIRFLADVGRGEYWDAPADAWRYAYGRAGKVVARLRQTVAQTGIAAGWADILLQTEDLDTHNGHAGSAGAWTCPPGLGGLYRAEGAVSFGPTGGGVMFAVRLVKGAPNTPIWGAQAHTFNGTNGGGPQVNTGSHLVPLLPGEFVYLQGYVNGAGWSTAIGAPTNEGVGSSLQIERVQ